MALKGVNAGRAKGTRGGKSLIRATSAVPAQEGAKGELINRLRGIGPRGWEEARGAINEALPKVEGSSSSESAPATSATLNGTYTMAFSGGVAPGIISSPTRALALLLYAGGYSPGLAALSFANSFPENAIDVRGVELSVGPSQPRARSDVTAVVAGQRELTASVLSDLDVAGESRLRERYVSVEIDGRQVEIPNQLRYTRDLYVSFLDDDLLIVRNSTGAPDVLLRHRSNEPLSVKEGSTATTTTTMSTITSPSSSPSPSSAPASSSSSSSSSGDSSSNAADAGSSSTTSEDKSSNNSGSGGGSSISNSSSPYSS